MSTIIPNTRRVMANAGHGFSAWLRRINTRNELSNLTDRDLRDIGISLCDAQRETRKPFWMA